WFFKSFFLFCGKLGLSCAASEISKKTTPLPPHHKKDGFTNIYNNPQHGFGKFLKWRLGMMPPETAPIDPDSLKSYHPIIVEPETTRIQYPAADKIQITWFGHCSFLIQIVGKNILTDPVFSKSASPIPFLGPQREVPLPMPLDHLPPIDIVIISHDHYDHLDKSTIKYLGNKPKYFVPLKLRKWFQNLGITNVVELDWWQSEMMDSLRFTAVPAQHFSGRLPFQFNKTLWAGWVIEAAGEKIYFAGDTGYCPHFKEIAARMGKIKIAFLPIGAYRPYWFMQAIHLDPAEAFQAFHDLNADYAIGMHWGTFKLSDEPLGEPPLYLKKVLQAAGLGGDKMIMLRFGETVEF
ncbi:MBL fold metallo-hydrolase, partial [candidate division KSB1 bacterium]|nr:MBL fold metallo-hydrolase [candidate division KSB1 bacterium]